MPRQRSARKPFDTVGEDFAKIIDIKRRLIEAGVQRGDLAPAREILESLRHFLRCLREDLSAHLREGSIKDMTPEQAQQAIYAIQLLEGSLQADYPELTH
jgi:hypothetical protein